MELNEDEESNSVSENFFNKSGTKKGVEKLNTYCNTTLEYSILNFRTGSTVFQGRFEHSQQKNTKVSPELCSNFVMKVISTLSIHSCEVGNLIFNKVYLNYKAFMLFLCFFPNS